MIAVEVDMAETFEPFSPAEAEKVLATEALRAAKRAGAVLEGSLKSVMAADRQSGSSMRSVNSAVDVRSPGEIILDVGASDPAVLYMSEGTGVFGPTKQRIRPRKSRVMKFPHRAGGGFRLDDQVRAGRRGRKARFVFTPTVEGIEPHDYFEKASQLAENEVEAIFDAAADRIDRRLTHR